MRYSELKLSVGEINNVLDLVAELSKIVPLEDVVSVTASMKDDLDHLRHVFKHSEDRTQRRFIAESIKELSDKIQAYVGYLDRKVGSAFDFEEPKEPLTPSKMFLLLNSNVRKVASSSKKPEQLLKKIASELRRTVLSLQRVISKDVVERRGVPVVISCIETNDQFSPWIVFSALVGGKEIQIYQIPRQEIPGTFAFEYQIGTNPIEQAKVFVLNGNLDNEIDYHYAKGFSEERLPGIAHPPWI